MQPTPSIFILLSIKPIKTLVILCLSIIIYLGLIHFINPLLFNAEYGTYIGVLICITPFATLLSKIITGLFVIGSTNLFPVSRYPVISISLLFLKTILTK